MLKYDDNTENFDVF